MRLNYATDIPADIREYLDLFLNLKWTLRESASARVPSQEGSRTGDTEVQRDGKETSGKGVEEKAPHKSHLI
jgi:hypothetical protein